MVYCTGMARTLNLDSQTENQPIEQPARRTIYDAHAGEIVWKSFVAGFSLGLGRMVANLIFFTIIAGLFVIYVQPWIDGYMQPLYDALENPAGSVTPSWLNTGFSPGSLPWNASPEPDSIQLPPATPTQTR